MVTWGHTDGQRDWRAGGPPPGRGQARGAARRLGDRAGEGRAGAGRAGGALIFNHLVDGDFPQHFQRVAPSVRLAASDCDGTASATC